MPNNAWPLPGTTKNGHLFLLFLCSIITLHAPSWVIVVLLQVFSSICLLTVSANHTFVTHGISFFENMPWHYVAIISGIYFVWY